jgi:hypothetical protein
MINEANERELEFLLVAQEQRKYTNGGQLASRWPPPLGGWVGYIACRTRHICPFVRKLYMLHLSLCHTHCAYIFRTQIWKQKYVFMRKRIGELFYF